MPVAKLPWPPPAVELATLEPDIYVLPAGSLLWRVYARGGPFPTAWRDVRHFGPLISARFDHHLPDSDGRPCHQARGILYAADSIVTCLAEFFQETRTINRSRREPWLVGMETVADLVLLNLRDVWPTRAGASMALNSGDRARVRRWSRIIYEAYPSVEGLWYCSSMNANNPSLALYDRGRHAIPAVPTFHRALADPTMFLWLAEAADRLRYGLV